MATKVGEAYYEVYPRINQRQMDLARAAIGKQLAAEFQRNAQKITAQSRISADSQIRDEDRVRKSRTRTTNEQTRDLNLVQRLREKLSNDIVSQNRKQEGSFHKLATQFRTIGTVGRGLLVGSTVLSSWAALRLIIGGITAAMPILLAGVAALPTAVAAIGVEAVILKAAFNGVGNAVKLAFDPKKAKEFNAALQELTPSARSFVKNLAGAKGILPNIQETFFSAPSLQAASKQLKPFFEGLAANLKKLTASNGNLFGQLFGAITNPSGTKSANDFLGNLNRFIKNITPGATAFLTGFVTFIDHVSQQFTGAGIGANLGKFGDFLAKVNTKSLFDNAKASAKGFGDLLGNVYGTLKGIFNALGNGNQGAAFFKSVDGFFGNLNQFANSPQGQQFLKDLIKSLDEISGLATSVSGSALKFLAQAFVNIQPQIGPFTAALGDLVAQLVPLGAPLGDLLGKGLGVLTSIIKTVTPIVRDIVNFLVAHPGVFEALGIAIGVIAVAWKAWGLVVNISKDILAVTKALEWFFGPNQIKTLLGMGEISAAEGAIGAAGTTAASGGVAKLILGAGKLFGAAGLFVLGVVAIEEVNKKLGDPVWDKFFDRIGLGTKAGDSITNSPFTRFLTDLGKKLGIVNGDAKDATQSLEDFKKATSFTDSQFPKGTNPNPNKPQTPAKPGSPGTPASPDQRNNLKNITPQAFAITGQINTLTTAFDKLNGSINTTITTAGTWAQNFPKSISGGVTTVGTTVNTNFPKNFTTPINAQFGIVTAGMATTWARMAASSLAGINQVGTQVKVLPTVFTNPIQTQYTLVEGKTNALWANVNRSFAAGLNVEKGQIAGLPTVLTTPTRNTYNAVIKATVGMWNNIGKQFQSGVHNMGLMSAQIVKSVTPGIQGLVKTYTENVKKVWDAVAKPLSLAVLAAVSFSGASVSVGNVPAPPTQTPIFVASGGPISGPGGPRDDKIRAWLSDGEFVVNAKQTARYGQLLSDINDGRNPDVNWSYKDGGELKLAGGGPAYAPNGKRSGRSYPIIKQFVRALPGGSGLGISATTGGGHISNSYHYSGEAVDWTGSHSRMNKVAREIWQGYSKYMLELIHSPSYFAHNGVKETHSQGKRTYGAVYAGHFNHIHTAMTKEAAKVALSFAKSGHAPGGSGGGPVAQPMSEAQANAIRDATAKNIPGTTVWDNMMRQIILQNLTKLQQKTVDKANSLIGFAGASGSANAKQINQWISLARGFTPIPSDWEPWLKYIINHESGGNPRAINRTDINAQQGHPSQGLMQLIPSNFSQFHDGAPNDILNPVSSIVAGINYIKSRYGTIFNTPWARGTGTFYKDGGLVKPKLFDTGGILDPEWNMIYNGTGKPEKLANVTDGQKVDVELHVRYDSAEAEKMVDARIEKNNRKITRVLTTKRR